MSDDDFWSITPSEYNALLERYEEEQERQDSRAGLICSVLANIYRDTKKQPKPYKPEDFMPQKKQKRKPSSKGATKDQLNMVTQLFGGNVK